MSSKKRKHVIDFSALELVDVLDEEEQVIHNALMAGEYESHGDAKTIKKYAEIFKNDAKQRKAISLRIPKQDYFSIKAKATKLGLPYQALINSIIHRFVSEDLDESYFKRQIKKIS